MVTRYDVNDRFAETIREEVYTQTGVDVREIAEKGIAANSIHPDYLNAVILAEAAKVPGVHDSTLIKIAEKSNWMIYRGFYQAEQEGIRFSADVVKALLENGDHSVKYGALRMSGLTEAVLLDLFPKEKAADVRSMMLPLINDPVVVNKAIKDRSVGVRCAAASHDKLTRESALVLAKDKNKSVVISMARHAKDVEVQRVIADSAHPHAAYYLATNSNLDGDIVRYMAKGCDSHAARVLLQKYGNDYPEIVEPIVSRTDPKDYRVIEAAVAVPALGLARRAEISVNSRSTRVRKWFFDSLTLEELQILVEVDDKKVREFASKRLVQKAFG